MNQTGSGGAASAPARSGFEWTMAALGAGFVLLLILGASSFLLFERNRANSQRVNAALGTELQISDVLSLMGQAESGQRGFLLTHDETYLAPYRMAVAAVPGVMDALAVSMASDDEQRVRAATLRDVIRQKLVEMQRILDIDRDAGREAGLAALRTDVGRDLMTEIRRTLGAANRRERVILEERFAAAQRDGNISLTIDALAILVILLLAVATVVRMRRALGDLGRSRADLAAINDNLEAIVATRTSDLREANEEIQRFAYIVSHDLRSPLVNIMGFTSELEIALAEIDAHVDQLAAEGPPPKDLRRAVKEDLPEAVRFIKSSTGRMDGLIGAILKLSREGRRTLTAERIDVAELVNGIVGALQHQSAEAGATLTVGALPPLVADRVALEQIFANLLDNALKYLQPGRPGRIAVTGRVAGDRALYEVADNGRGIAPQDHQRIFELFRRSGVQDKPGEGIGLAHVRTLVRALGGTIDCVSTLDEGTSFRLSLPRRTAREGSTIA